MLSCRKARTGTAALLALDIKEVAHTVARFTFPSGTGVMW